MKQISKVAAILGKKGGSSTSERKAKAARKNGKRGGRPRKGSVEVIAETLQQMSGIITRKAVK